MMFTFLMSTLLLKQKHTCVSAGLQDHNTWTKLQKRPLIQITGWEQAKKSAWGGVKFSRRRATECRVMEEQVQQHEQNTEWTFFKLLRKKLSFLRHEKVKRRRLFAQKGIWEAAGCSDLLEERQKQCICLNDSFLSRSPSIYLSVYFSVYPSISVCLIRSVTHLPVRLSICQSVCPSHF